VARWIKWLILEGFGDFSAGQAGRTTLLCPVASCIIRLVLKDSITYTQNMISEF